MSREYLSQILADGDTNEWLVLSKGLCEKLAGGSLTPPAKEDK